MSRRNSKFLRVVCNLVVLVLILSAFGVTLGDILEFDWFDDIAGLIINFFSI